MNKLRHPYLCLPFSLIFSILVIFSLPVNAQPLETFKLSEVRLLDSDFKTAQQRDMEYILALDADRLLYPFLREAGLPSKAMSYPNWENTGLDGHIGGHYLTALALMYASTGNEELNRRLVYMLDQLQKCQDANGNGYIGGVPGSKELWQEIASGNIRAGSFELNKKWVPLYNIHKLYAGLRDAYVIAGNGQAKEMLIRYTDWMHNLVLTLSDAQVQDMLRSEHGGLNEVFADVYDITKDKKYLVLAKRFSHESILKPLQHAEDMLTGMHANTQIPKVIGFKRIADLDTSEKNYNQAARFFWDNVVTKRTVAIGGNSVREHFHPVNDFSSMINDVQGPETCNTYNMLKLSGQFYLSDQSLKYMDFYERALYNHILSSVNLSTGGFVYFTPMRPGHYRVYSQPQTSFWCCVGSGLENHGKYGELIYAHRGKELYVNLFIPSRLNWKEQGFTITQQTKFPEESSSSFVFNTKKTATFSFLVRYPSWVRPGGLKIKVNGKAWPVTAEPGAYAAIQRSWQNGDRVTVELPMQTTTEKLPDSSNYVAVMHGPIVLAAATDTTDLHGLYADESRGGHIATGRLVPLNDLPYFLTNGAAENNIKPIAGKPLHFTAERLVAPAQFKNLVLKPFYKIHNTRYILYWQQLTPAQLKANEERLRLQQLEEAHLAAQTLDLVIAGEQQPESDHFVQSSESQTGVNQNRHWRDARGWFSYRMKHRGATAAMLSVTYFGGDRNRNFMITANGQEIAKVALAGNKGDVFYTVDYPIPAAVIAASKEPFIEIKFTAAPNSIAGGVYAVRLMKAK